MNLIKHNGSDTLKVMALSIVMLSTWGNFGIANVEASDNKSTPLLTDESVALNNPKSKTTTLNNPTTSHNAATLDIASLTMTVYKSPTCGCCSGWVEYMREEGFTVNSVDTDDVHSIKTQLGLNAPELKSCHTAVINGYVIEGHVPANDVKRLLSETPEILGLTAPGMPMMSPGMASRIPKDYDVLAFDKVGGTGLWSAY
ncbi:MAG: hypothetical protein ACI8VW_003418 [bacterium]|jgi:hypothetical protein